MTYGGSYKKFKCNAPEEWGQNVSALLWSLLRDFLEDAGLPESPGWGKVTGEASVITELWDWLDHDGNGE